MQGDCSGKSCNLSGERGIRTPESVSPITRFPDVDAPTIPQLITNELQITIKRLALILRFFGKNRVVKLSFSRQQPPRINIMVGHQEGQP